MGLQRVRQDWATLPSLRLGWTNIIIHMGSCTFKSVSICFTALQKARAFSQSFLPIRKDKNNGKEKFWLENKNFGRNLFSRENVCIDLSTRVLTASSLTSAIKCTEIQVYSMSLTSFCFLLDCAGDPPTQVRVVLPHTLGWSQLQLERPTPNLRVFLSKIRREKAGRKRACHPVTGVLPLRYNYLFA